MNRRVIGGCSDRQLVGPGRFQQGHNAQERQHHTGQHPQDTRDHNPLDPATCFIELALNLGRLPGGLRGWIGVAGRDRGLASDWLSLSSRSGMPLRSRSGSIWTAFSYLTRTSSGISSGRSYSTPLKMIFAIKMPKLSSLIQLKILAMRSRRSSAICWAAGRVNLPRMPSRLAMIRSNSRAQVVGSPGKITRDANRA